jgi:hypothetical protein
MTDSLDKAETPAAAGMPAKTRMLAGSRTNQLQGRKQQYFFNRKLSVPSVLCFILKVGYNIIDSKISIVLIATFSE